MLAFDDLDFVFCQVRQCFSVRDPEGLALGKTPAFEAVGDVRLVALVGGRVEIGAAYIPGQVLLRRLVIQFVVEAHVSFAMAEF